MHSPSEPSGNAAGVETAEKSIETRQRDTRSADVCFETLSIYSRGWGNRVRIEHFDTVSYQPRGSCWELGWVPSSARREKEPSAALGCPPTQQPPRGSAPAGRDREVTAQPYHTWAALNSTEPGRTERKGKKKIEK